MAGLPTRKAEWDQAIAGLGPEFGEAFEALGGATYRMRTDPAHNRPWEIAQAQGEWYGMAAERLSGKPGMSIRVLPDESGEERWLACGPQVGQGGFGSVVLAERPADGFPSATSDTLAIKIAIRGKVLDDRMLDRAVPGIAAPFIRGESRDLGSTLHEQTVVMDGFDAALDRFMGHRFKPAEAARFLTTIDQGLAEGRIDGSRFAHGDIKPDNTLVRFDRATGQAVFALGDTGNAKKFGDSVAKALTPEYAPADQLTGVATAKHDSFAASAVAFEMLTGKPFRDDVVVPATATRDRIDDRFAAIHHESGYRAMPGMPQWETILASGYDPDPERRVDMTGVAARAQAFLVTDQERACLRPQDLTRYAEFLSRDRSDHDRHFAVVDRAAADALLRDSRLDDASRSRLVNARRQMIEPPRAETHERVVALAERENACRQAQLSEAANKIRDLKLTPVHESRSLGNGRQSLSDWEAQRRIETARGADPSRGPPSRGPTR